MTGSKILVAAAIAALFFLLPNLVSAQRTIPHAFLGSATVNGSPAPNGASVAAFIDGEQVGAVSVVDGGYPTLLIAQPEGVSFAGKRVFFTIGGLPAAETAVWEQGLSTILNLTGAPGAADTSTADPGSDSDCDRRGDGRGWS